jgi:hypothetical protein
VNGLVPQLRKCVLSHMLRPPVFGMCVTNPTDIQVVRKLQHIANAEVNDVLPMCGAYMSQILRQKHTAINAHLYLVP